MKIYKISQNFQYLPQNPTGEANQDVNLQNMQNAQSAIGSLNNIIEAASNLNSAIDKLEEVANVGDIGIKQIISNKLNEALKLNDAVSLLMHMNLLPSVETLFDSTKFGWIQTKIVNDMQSIKNSPSDANTKEK